MTRLKRWESPRREGRNAKGRGGSARQRQKRKQIQVLRQKLKQSDPPVSSEPDNLVGLTSYPEGREPNHSSLLFFELFLSRFPTLSPGLKTPNTARSTL